MSSALDLSIVALLERQRGSSAVGDRLVQLEDLLHRLAHLERAYRHLLRDPTLAPTVVVEHAQRFLSSSEEACQRFLGGRGQLQQQRVVVSLSGAGVRPDSTPTSPAT